MSGELKVAANIQMSMLPLTFPRFPEHKDIDVWAKLRPAREVGGDFYDFFFIDEKHFAFVIADVSGKGAPAALFMAVTKTLLKANSQDVLSPSISLERINNELSENNDDCMFVTLFFGIIDLVAFLPTYLSVFIPGSEMFLVVRVLRVLRIFRVLKILPYITEAQMLRRALVASRRKICGESGRR